MTTSLFELVYIRVKSQINITRMKNLPPSGRFGDLTGACVVLTGEAAAHISCRNEMMQRTALCAILLLKRW
jgi:hypothetical protein